jgi:hypothetical protein
LSATWYQTNQPDIYKRQIKTEDGRSITEFSNSLPGAAPATAGFLPNAAPAPQLSSLGFPSTLASMLGVSSRNNAPSGPRVSVIGDSSADDRERQDLISAASTPYKGSPNGQLTANQLRVLAGIRDSEGKNALARETATVNNAAGIEREQLQQQGANQRAALGAALQWPESQERAVGLGINNRLAAQKEGALNNYMNAQTPEARNKALQQLQALGEKPEGSGNVYAALPGGQGFNPETGQPFTLPSRVFNTRTGEVVQQSGQSEQGQKTVSLDQVEATAKRRNMSVEAVKKDLQANGWGIV